MAGPSLPASENAIVEAGRPLLHRNEIEARPYLRVRYTRLAPPLSDDGTTVNMVLCVTARGRGPAATSAVA